MFRLQALRQALHQAIEDGFMVTDEASAMEHIGLKPKLVEGHADNIKITRPEDLPLAEFYLQTIYLYCGKEKEGMREKDADKE
jgi:2-C-methyl-D-erythritol 4-phosphate cytidylyltransferase